MHAVAARRKATNERRPNRNTEKQNKNEIKEKEMFAEDKRGRVLENFHELRRRKDGFIGDQDLLVSERIDTGVHHQLPRLIINFRGFRDGTVVFIFILIVHLGDFDFDGAVRPLDIVRIDSLASHCHSKQRILKLRDIEFDFRTTWSGVHNGAGLLQIILFIEV